MVIDLNEQGTQTALALLVGVTQPTISNLMSEGKLPSSGTLGELLQAYCARLRDQAAGRLGDSLGLDLVQERAALAREQRIGQAIKNGVARKEYAPVGLLADVLGTASSAVVDRFDHLESLSEILCVRHSMSTRSMNATQDQTHRFGGPGGTAAISHPGRAA